MVRVTVTGMFDADVQAVMDRVDRLRDEVDDHWQIPRDEALLLAQFVRIGRCRSLCEIGASYGFSTLHVAAAARENFGHLHTIDIDPRKVEATVRHLTEAGLGDVVTVHEGDARSVLRGLTPEQPFDFVFIDAVKAQSFAYLEAVTPQLAGRAMVVTDNTVSHREELAPFVAHLRAMEGAHSCEVAVGNGFELTLLQRFGDVPW